MDEGQEQSITLCLFADVGSDVAKGLRSGGKQNFLFLSKQTELNNKKKKN
jgi:hypothetical protein